MLFTEKQTLVKCHLVFLTIFLLSSFFSPSFLSFKGRSIVFSNQRSLIGKKKEETMRNFKLNGKNIFGKF